MGFWQSNEKLSPQKKPFLAFSILRMLPWKMVSAARVYCPTIDAHWGRQKFCFQGIIKTPYSHCEVRWSLGAPRRKLCVKAAPGSSNSDRRIHAISIGGSLLYDKFWLDQLANTSYELMTQTRINSRKSVGWWWIKSLHRPRRCFTRKLVHYDYALRNFMRSTDSCHRTGASVERVRQSTLMAAYNARAGLRSWGQTDSKCALCWYKRWYK